MSITKETQNFDSIDFTHLDVLQPHLSLPPPPSASRRHQRERGVVTVDEGSGGERTVYSSASVECDRDGSDGDVAHSIKDTAKADNEPVQDSNSNHITINQNGYRAEDSAPGNGPSSSTAVGDNANSSSGPNSQPSTATSNPIQICYSKNTGNISVREGQVTSVGPNGTPYIATQQITEQWDENERKPLRKKRIRWVKIFSIISCILFFPTGIPAAYYAFRVEKEFEQGILRGNIDRAQKFATRSERLCILSVILCILMAALIVTLIERPQFQSDHYHRGTVTG